MTEKESDKKSEKKEPGRKRRAISAAWSRIIGSLAALVRAIAAVLAAILVVHIVLVIGGANPDNSITKGIANLAMPLALGFKGLFSPSNPKVLVLVNFGLAAIFWLVLGTLLALVVRRFAKSRL